MDSKLLNQNIDEAVAEAILSKLVEFKTQIAKNYQAKLEEAKVGLFKHVEAIVEERENEIKEEYSARVLAKLKEKNEIIAEMEESIEQKKEELAEKVNQFLSNSKNEIRSLVEEEIRVDSDTLKANRVVEEIRALVGNQPVVTTTNVDENKITRLAEDVEVLKERIGRKDSAITKLKAQLKVYEMVEGVPGSDRDFYLAQLKDVDSINEAEATFNKIKKAVKSSRYIVEEAPRSKGRIQEEVVDHSPRTGKDSKEVNAFMRKLAGI